MRSSPVYGVSTPPLKKYVTCAYFSVSAHSQLRESERSDVFAEAHRHRLWRKGDGKLPEFVAITRQTDERRKLRRTGPRESVERLGRQRTRQLAGAVGTEVHEDDAARATRCR